MASTKHTTSTALVAMASVVITSFVVAVLYVARDILIPLSLAALLSFLLSPLVMRLERWIGRVAAALLAVAVLFSILGGVGWVLTRQVLDLATRLPDYKENIRVKLRVLKMPGGGRFSKLSATVEELKKELPAALRREHRCLIHRTHRRSGLLDLAVGRGGPRARHATHCVPRRDGPACAAARHPFRAALR